MLTRRTFLKMLGISSVGLLLPNILQAQSNDFPSINEFVEVYAYLLEADEPSSLRNTSSARRERARVNDVMEENNFTLRRTPEYRLNSIEFYTYEHSRYRDVDACTVFFPNYLSGRKPVLESTGIIGSTVAILETLENSPNISKSRLADMFVPTGYVNNPDVGDLFTNNDAVYAEYETENGSLETIYEPTGRSSGDITIRVRGRQNNTFDYSYG